MLVTALGSVGSPALPEGEFPSFEMAEEFIPFL
jgi:hypothetical protein